MSTGNDPTRRVPTKLQSSGEFWRGYTIDDLLVGATPFIAMVLITAYLLPANVRVVGYVLAGVALVVGAVAVHLAPDHLTASEWVDGFVHRIRTPDEMRNVRYDFDAVREQTDYPEAGVLELAQRTQDLIDVERIHTDIDAIERTDGAIVGAVRVEPTNMALTTPTHWRDNVDAFTDFLNNTVEWPIEIFSTTTPFPVEDYVSRREQRLEDDDVRENAVFRDLIEYWLDWYPRELELRGTNLREYYVVVPVRPEDVEGGEREERTAVDKLADLPGIGALFGRLASGDELSEAERRDRMQRTLDERLSMVENEGFQSIDGCRASRVEGPELARVLIRYWSGEDANYGDMEQVLRDGIVVDGDGRGSAGDGAWSDRPDAAEDAGEPGGESADGERSSDGGGRIGGLLPFGSGGDGGPTVPAGRVTDEVAALHRGVIAPQDAVFERDRARLGRSWVKSLWAEGYPDQPADGFLERLFTEPGVDTDVAIHVEPRDTRIAQEELKDRVGTLQAEYERKQERRDVDARGIQKDLEDAEQMYDVLRNTPTEIFDVSMYVNVRGDDEEDLASANDTVRSTLRRAPANVTPVTAVNRQDQAIRSASPVARDHLNKKSAMMGGAVGAMFPFSSSSLIEETGVEYGVHAFNGSPVIVDRFDRDVGYNALVIGNIGSGKSFSTKLNLVRTLASDEDTIVVMLDPLEGFVGVNRALGGERVVVGGNVGLNPLEIRETPDEVLEQEDVGEELDPFGAKLKDVMSFFDTYFAMRENPLEDRRGTLESAVRQAYEERGIDRDPETHGKESPTVSDVIDVLTKMAEDPEEHTVSEAEEERDTIASHAADLLIGLEPFTEGAEFANLAQETDIDIGGSDVVYLDLQQQETRGGTGLMMQLLFNAVYERAKEETDKRVVFAIDEARYIMKDAENLGFLEQAVRHSRHYDLSIQFITQTIDEFFAQDESEAIADNCSLKLLHRIEGMDADLGGELDLTPQQRDYVRTAMAGDEAAGYSEALLGVSDEGWYPIHVRANELERQIIDFDPRTDETLDGENLRDGVAGADGDGEVSTAHEQSVDVGDRLGDVDEVEDVTVVGADDTEDGADGG